MYKLISTNLNDYVMAANLYANVRKHDTYFFFSFLLPCFSKGGLRTNIAAINEKLVKNGSHA